MRALRFITFISTLLLLAVTPARTDQAAAPQVRVHDAAMIKTKLIKANLDLKRIDAVLQERQSETQTMTEIMPRDHYGDDSLFEYSIGENQEFLQALNEKRAKLVTAIAFFEKKYGFGPEIYNNRAVAAEDSP